MKMHLFRPGDDLTMCGIQIKSFSTTNPVEATCQRCLGFYEANKFWYSNLVRQIKENWWFHWSPTAVRPRILHSGLLPNQWSRDRLWKPPYVCLAPSPLLGWSLSGGMGQEPQIESWDLWEVFVGEQKGYEELKDDRNGRVKEIRVYERIYKRNVYYLGSRSDG